MPTTETSVPVAAPAPPAPPKRRRRWRIAVGVVVFLIAAGAGYLFVANWVADRQLQEAFAELDAEDPNWRWRDLCAELAPPPDEVNSTLQVQKVHDLLKLRAFAGAATWATATEKTLLLRRTRLHEDHVKMLQAAFDRLDPKTLAEARKLKDMPNGRHRLDPEAGNLFEMRLDWIQNTREVMSLLQADALLRGQTDLEGSAESCLALLNTSRSINDHPTLVSQLVRIAGQATSFAAIERLLGQGELKEETLQRLQEALQREADTNMLQLGMRGEVAGTHSFFQSVREGKTSVGALLGGGGKRGPDIGERLLDMFPGFILRGEADHLRMMLEITKASKLEGPARNTALDKVEDKVRKSRNITVRMLVPAVTKVSDASNRTSANMRCAVVAVAAERYRLRHDAWPKDLNVLVKEGLLKEVPRDPYDGQPLRWKLMPEKGALVYSVGRDKTDNGGRIDRAANPFTNGLDQGFELWWPTQRGIAPPAIEEKID